MKESHVPIVLLSIIVLICITGESQEAGTIISYISKGTFFIFIAYFIIKAVIKKSDNDKNK